MILRFSDNFLGSCKAPDISDLICEAIVHGHFIDVTSGARRLIRQDVSMHGSTNQKALFSNHGCNFDISENIYKYLTTWEIDESYSFDNVMRLIKSPSRLVTENAHQEWPVYKAIIDLYKSDPVYGDYFSILKTAKDSCFIEEAHAGGTGELLKEADARPLKHNTENLLLKRTCILFDSDRDNPDCFDGNKNHLFKSLCGKEYTDVMDDDIYTLDHIAPVWHMWYKRAIENYFPDSQYREINCDTAQWDNLSSVEKDYVLLDRKSTPGYEKKRLAELVATMNRKKFETNLKKFTVGGEDMSEMQLFLLKLVKIL